MAPALASGWYCESYSEQFVNLIDLERSSLQITVQRLKHLTVDHAGWMVVCCNEYRFLVAEQQLQEIGADVDEIFLERHGAQFSPDMLRACKVACEKNA